VSDESVDGDVVGRGRVAWLAFVVVVLFVPNLAAVAAPFEHWPWTCAPMFAASPLDNARYKVAFVVEEADGGSHPMSSKQAAGMSEWHFRRAFLVKVWGSDDDGAPYGHVDGDSAAAREARVAACFDAMVRFATKKKRRTFDGAVAIRVELQEVHPQQQTRVLGRYSLKDRRFSLEGGS
jgi:hypothetical protein